MRGHSPSQNSHSGYRDSSSLYVRHMPDTIKEKSVRVGYQDDIRQRVWLTRHGVPPEGRCDVEEHQLQQVKETFRHLALRATHDPVTAQQLRDALAESGLLDVFGEGPALDVIDLLDAGGEETLRARLSGMTAADLRKVIAARNYDPNKETARWRSVARLTDFIVAQAWEESERLDQAQPKALSAASWLL